MKFELSKAEFQNVVMGGLIEGYGPMSVRANMVIKSVHQRGVMARKSGRDGTAVIELTEDPDYVEPDESAEPE